MARQSEGVVEARQALILAVTFGFAATVLAQQEAKPRKQGQPPKQSQPARPSTSWESFSTEHVVKQALLRGKYLEGGKGQPELTAFCMEPVPLSGSSKSIKTRHFGAYLSLDMAAYSDRKTATVGGEELWETRIEIQLDGKKATAFWPIANKPRPGLLITDPSNVGPGVVDSPTVGQLKPEELARSLKEAETRNLAYFDRLIHGRTLIISFRDAVGFPVKVQFDLPDLQDAVGSTTILEIMQTCGGSTLD